MQEQGIQDFVAALYEQNYKRLYCQGLNFFGGKKEYIEDIEECVQDVFLETYKNHKMLKSHENIEAWLSTALRYRLHNKLYAVQRMRRHVAFSLDQSQYEGSLTGKAIDEIGRFEAMDSIMAMMRCLPRHDCELLCDRYLRQRSVAEMAQEKQTTPGTIRAFLSKARRNAKSIVYMQYAACS